MDNIPIDSLDRSELAAFVGQQVSFEGVVRRVTAPTPTAKYVCLGSVRIAERNDDVVFNQRDQIRYDHIWLDISDINHNKARMTDNIIGSGTVVKYVRKDGTSSYGIRFVEKGLNDIGLLKALKQKMATLRMTTPHLTVDQHVKLCDELIENTKSMIMSGRVNYHDFTKGSLLQFLENSRCGLLRGCGVLVTNNRRGRRQRGEGLRARVHRSPCIKGFA